MNGCTIYNRTVFYLELSGVWTTLCRWCDADHCTRCTICTVADSKHSHRCVSRHLRQKTYVCTA